MTDRKIISPMGGMPDAKLNINPKELDDVVCEKCGNFTFQHLTLLKILPALVSPSGKTTYVPVDVMACAACGNIPEMMAKGLAAAWFKNSTMETADKNAEAIKGSNLPGLEVITPKINDAGN